MSSVTPKNTDEVADFINSAITDKVALEIIGGGSKRGLGEACTADTIMDTSALSGIVAYTPEELVVTVQAATPMSELQAALAEKRQMLAFEPPDLSALFGQASNRPPTIGGAVMCNLSGSRRPFIGAARDFLLGFSGVSGRGEIFKAGGKVVKNVTGFDLSKLITGSYGTLAVVGEMTLKTYPIAELQQSWSLACDDMQTARTIMEKAINAAFPPTGAAFVPHGDGVILRFEGGMSPLQAAQAHVQSLGGFRLLAEGAESASLWEKIGSVGVLDLQEGDFLWKISLPPSESPKFVATIAADETYFADWGGGLLWLQTATEARAGDIRTQNIRKGAEQCGGYAHLIRCPAGSAVPRFHPRPAAELQILKNIKAGFDPHAILNPNRMGF